MIIRAANIQDASSIAKIHVDGWRQAYAELIDQDYLDSMDYLASEKKWIANLTNSADMVYLVASSKDNQILGFCVFEPVSLKIKLKALYVGSTSQRNGVGKAFLKYLLEYSIRHKVKEIIVWVLKDNPFLRFYTKFGAAYSGESEIQIGAKSYIQLCYKWGDLDILKSTLQ